MNLGRHVSSEKSHGVDGTKTIGEMNRETEAWSDKQPMVIRCVLEDCDWKFEGPAGEARVAAAEHRAGNHQDVAGWVRGVTEERPNGGAPMDAAREALERMDEGEPQQPAQQAPRNGKPTHESLVEDIKAHVAQTGQPPQADRSPGSRIYYHAKKLGLAWPDLLETAGLERPEKGKRRGPVRRSAVRTEKPAPARSAAPPPLAQIAADLETTQAELERATAAYEQARKTFFEHPLVAGGR